MKSLNDEIKKVEERATEAEKGNLSKATDETYSNSLVVLMLAMSANCPPSTPLHAGLVFGKRLCLLWHFYATGKFPGIQTSKD